MAAPQRAESAPRKERFEDYLGQVEEAVRQLEGGALPLEDSLVQYENGVKALKHCHEILEAAEKRVQVLLRSEDGSTQAQPLDLKKSEEVEREERSKRKSDRGPGASAAGNELPF